MVYYYNYSLIKIKYYVLCFLNLTIFNSLIKINYYVLCLLNLTILNRANNIIISKLLSIVWL